MEPAIADAFSSWVSSDQIINVGDDVLERQEGEIFIGDWLE